MCNFCNAKNQIIQQTFDCGYKVERTTLCSGLVIKSSCDIKDINFTTDSYKLIAPFELNYCPVCGSKILS